ncbi:ABC transporter substrate-binding protein [Bacillus sp. 31A1R]|uniref:ABC transporter substrate-binding protein n=1 Tax=Robertmurraya mangrovi TaxID=3098077 RepID=A0ABU5J4A7_9BACI|nr:ABC transporter substrate-binding protein [Bacillus sp. 31A1R]MDZ5474206.1 ABC transporter substrate-binding protein [Bacillus sp. 31A1R]
MKKFYSVLFLVLLSLGVLAGCGETKEIKEESKPATEEKVEAEFPVTIKDALDNDVVIEAKPEKIVSLIPSNTEIAFALGLNKEIVGVSDFDNYPEEATTKEKIGGMEFNLEKIISLNPDLVLAHASSAHNSTEGLQQLRDAGITVFVVQNAANFDEVYETIQVIGTVTGEKEEAEKIVANMKAKIDEIKTKAASIKEKKVVFVEVSPAPDIYTPGKNTFMDEMLTMVGAENAASDLEGWVKIDQEAMIERNPDVVLTTYGYYSEDPVGQVLSREGWGNVTAVKEKQIFDVDSDMTSRSGPRLVEGVEAIAKAVYPEVFK